MRKGVNLQGCKDKREIIDIINDTNLTPDEIVEAYLHHKM
jgi:hypothetical protein